MTDPEKFRDEWHSHVDDLERLKQTLPESFHDWLEDEIDELNNLVEIAAAELEEEQDG